MAIAGVSTTMDNLNTKILANVSVPMPPLSEQRAIAAHLDRETARLDALMAKVREGIGKLREYRAALIAAAVTGKMDVRAASGP
jgi:restriction endonuclease S subunit